MNTPDGHDKQNAGARGDPSARPLLRTTRSNDHRPGAFEQVLFKISAALRPFVAARLTEEHSLLFAEPVADPQSGQVRWYSPVEGEVVPYAQLTPKDKTSVDSRVNKMLYDLLELARKLQADPQTLEDYIMGQLLELQLEDAYSEKECLYLVGLQPVFASWAFETGQTPGVVEPPPPTPAKRTPARPAPRQPEREPEPDEVPATTAKQPPRKARPVWSPQQLGMVAGVLAIIFVGLFGFSPRSQVIAWLDRAETIRAREEALLRIIARDQRVRNGLDVSPEEIDAELKESGVPVEATDAGPQPDVEEEAEEEPPEPPPPFESARGLLPLDKVPGSILILHFWAAADPGTCDEVTSLVSMVTAESFDAVRELGGEAYLVTNAESVDQGNEILKACGVQDPFPLRDPGGVIFNRLVGGTAPPLTVIYDKLSERVLATYPRRNWLDPAAVKELQKLFLMQAF